MLPAPSRSSTVTLDILPPGARLDFGRRFLPEALARTDCIAFLSEPERRVLNQIRGHEYLALFGLVEEFILPFVLDHARPQLNGDDHRVRALLNFAGEEAKHIHLFRLFHRRFTDGFGTPCEAIGPAEAIAAEVLRHDPLAVALVILQIEWMTQRHYLDSVRDDGELDPLFKSLLKHHWMEEAQHAKLDTLMVEALAEGRDEAGIQAAIDGYLEIGAFLDGGFEAQAGFNLDAFERATGRRSARPSAGSCRRSSTRRCAGPISARAWSIPKFVATLAALSPSPATASPPSRRLSPDPPKEIDSCSTSPSARRSTASTSPRSTNRRRRARDDARRQVAFRVRTDWKGQTEAKSTVDSYTLAGEVVPRSFTIVADEPHELLGTRAAPNPQELLMSAVNACMVVGYVAQASVRGITLDACRIETEGELDLRGFLGMDESVPAGYRRISYTVFLEGDGTREQYEEIHQAVMATSPNYFNMAQPIQMVGRLA